MLPFFNNGASIETFGEQFSLYFTFIIFNGNFT